jgi:hypothetical protein
MKSSGHLAIQHQETVISNIARTHRPLVSRRRIEHLKQLAYDCNLTAEQAREYGKLSATATWEKLLTAHGLEFEPKTETTRNTVTIANQESPRQLNLLEWVDFGQLLAVSLASLGFAVLVLSLWPRINPLNLFPPVRINIQIGTK